MIATKTKHATSSPSNNWEKADDVITHNDVIDAYIRGKVVGRDEAQMAMKKVFESNLDIAQKNAERLFSLLMNQGINVASMHLKAESINDFMILIIAAQNDYASEKFLKAISAGRQIKNECSKGDFNLQFFYTYTADTLKEDCLDADGYFLKYAHA